MTPIPPKAKALHGDRMERKEIEFPKKRKIRPHRVEVRLSVEEMEKLKNANSSSVAKLLRESALSVVGSGEGTKPYFTKLDKEFVLELARIGTNINQIARAINTDLARDRPLDAVKLLHLLIGIDQTLKELRNDC